MPVILRQGIKKILVKPGKVNPPLQGQLIPAKGAHPLLISPDQKGAEGLQHLVQGIKAVDLLQQPLVNSPVIAQVLGVSRGPPGQVLPQVALSGRQIQHLNLKLSHTGHQIRVIL